MRRAEPAGESGPGENASTCDGSAWRGKGVGDVLQRVLWVVQVCTLVCDLKSHLSFLKRNAEAVVELGERPAEHAPS